MTWVFVFLGVLAVGIFLVAYWSIIKSNMETVADALAKDARAEVAGGFHKILIVIDGWKTHILAWVSALWVSISLLLHTLPDDVVSGWKDLPWAQVFDQKIAALITIACTMLIPITHSLGLSKAATTPPQNTTPVP